VNGDGYADIVVGAPGEQPRIAIYLGGPNGPSGTPAIYGDPSGSAPSLSYLSFNFGEAVSGAGDVNSDGFDDVIVGAPIVSGYKGVAYLYFGSAAGLVDAPVRIEVPGSNSFGQAVSGAGDVNGDGFSDVLIGMPEGDLSSGRTYVYFGSATGLTNSVALASPGSRAGFGFALR
jgi:hypothetical protein